jgi:hypothetical protein
MENFFKKFNEDFFKSEKNITWYDTEGVYRLDDNRVVTITLSDVGTRDHYNGYVVEIFNKQNGSIVKKFFRFQFHLEMNHNGRKFYYVWYQGGNLDWYISRPKNTKDMVKTIFDYINKFK